MVWRRFIALFAVAFVAIGTFAPYADERFTDAEWRRKGFPGPRDPRFVDVPPAQHESVPAIDLRRTDAPDGRPLACVLALNPPRRIGDPALDLFEMGFEMPRVDPDAEEPPLHSGILGARAFFRLRFVDRLSGRAVPIERPVLQFRNEGTTAGWRVLPPGPDGSVRVEWEVANSLRTTQALGEVMSRDDPMIVATLPVTREDRIIQLGRFLDFDKRDAVDGCLCDLDPKDSLMYVACMRRG